MGFSLALAENEIGGTTLATIADSEATAGGDVTVLANDGGVRELTSGAWDTGNNALVVDGSRRFADLKEPDQVVVLQFAGKKAVRKVGGGRLVTVRELTAEIFDGLRGKTPASGAVRDALHSRYLKALGR